MTFRVFMMAGRHSQTGEAILSPGSRSAFGAEQRIIPET